jgi:hypothetical protein
LFGRQKYKNRRAAETPENEHTWKRKNTITIAPLGATENGSNPLNRPALAQHFAPESRMHEATEEISTR